MSYFNLFQEELDKGLNNEPIYLPLSQSKLNSNIFFGKSMYFLIGGLPGNKKHKQVKGYQIRFKEDENPGEILVNQFGKTLRRDARLKLG